MQTNFPRTILHKPNYILIDATNHKLGRLASIIANILQGKQISYYTPGIDQGNFVLVINADKIIISGKKNEQKIYYNPTQRPGNLKKETFKSLLNRFPSRIIEKAVWGMLPKGVLGRRIFKRLYVYSGKQPLLKKGQNDKISWISLNI